MKVRDIDIEVTIAGTFLKGQYELYKQKFVNTDDGRYIDNMNDIHKVMLLFQFMQRTIYRLSAEKKELQDELKILKQ